MKPIKPSAVTRAKTKSIPGKVFEAFNELITLKWNGDEATVHQPSVVDLILEKIPAASREQIYERNWLDIETSYRRAGWIVEYDKPGYNEEGEAYFVFKKRRTR